MDQPGREHVPVHQRQRAGLPPRRHGRLEREPAHRRVLRHDAVGVAGLRLDKGSHSVSFGGSWTRPHSDGDGTFQSNGTFTFSGLITSGTTNANGGLNMADFVLGLPSAFNQGGSQINDQVLHSVGLYVADVWRVNRRLTLNYGLRWEPYFAARDQNNFTTAFIRENFDKGIRSVVYTNAPAGVVFPGDPGFPDEQCEQQRTT